MASPTAFKEASELKASRPQSEAPEAGHVGFGQMGSCLVGMPPEVTVSTIVRRVRKTILIQSYVPSSVGCWAVTGCEVE